MKKYLLCNDRRLKPAEYTIVCRDIEKGAQREQIRMVYIIYMQVCVGPRRED